MSFLFEPETPLWADRSSRTALTVTQLTRYLADLLGADDILQEIWVRGELSNVTYHGSGHVYFGMKDETACLRCVMFRNEARALPFALEAGMQILAHGHLAIYERRGEYQLIADDAQPDGIGALYLAFEQLKTRLEAEGLFAPERKRPIPVFPRRVAVITSPTGAAIHDICTIIRRRCPATAVIVVPAIVQGDDAPESLCQAIAAANDGAMADVLIVARGGGSLEDLWAFNAESVARAIAASRLPVISAVGHETDVTIADFAADLRAPTPSAAAELIAPDFSEMQRRAAQAEERLVQALRYRLDRARDELHALLARPPFARPFEGVHRRRQELDDVEDRLRAVSAHTLERERLRLAGLAGRLQALSPLSVLARGYAVVTRHPAGEVIRSPAGVGPGDAIRVQTRGGAFDARVTEPWMPERELSLEEEK
jgi:exodeoxyribonuclease VII large subunit